MEWLLYMKKKGRLSSPERRILKYLNSVQNFTGKGNRKAYFSSQHKNQALGLRQEGNTVSGGTSCPRGHKA